MMMSINYHDDDDDDACWPLSLLILPKVAVRTLRGHFQRRPGDWPPQAGAGICADTQPRASQDFLVPVVPEGELRCQEPQSSTTW